MLVNLRLLNRSTEIKDWCEIVDLHIKNYTDLTKKNAEL